MASDSLYVSSSGSTGYTSAYQQSYPSKVPSTAKTASVTYLKRTFAMKGVGGSGFKLVTGGNSIYASAVMSSLSYKQYPSLNYVYGANPVNDSVSFSCKDAYGAAAYAISGYSFIGWYDSSKTKYPAYTSTNGIGSNSDISNAIKIGPSYETVTAYAVFGKRYYTYFDKNGGSGWMKQDGSKTSTSVYWQAFYGAEDYYVRKAPSNDRSGATSCAFLFYKDGYAFNGWNTKSDGSGTHYDEGDDLATLSSLTSSGANNATLYAQWKKQHIVKITNEDESIGTYTLKDGDGNVLAESVDGVCEYAALSGDVLYAHVDFNESLYSATLGGESISSSSPREITVGDEDVSLSATFTAYPLYAVNISCDSSKGSVDVSPAADKDGKWLSKILTFTIHSNRGYTPSTFSAKSNGVSVIGNEEMALKDGMEISTTAAISDDVDVSISFDANAMYALARLDGESRGMGSVTPEEPINVSAGDEVEFNAVAADSIFVFDGWYDAEGESVSSDAAYTATVSEDTILYARFKLADEAPSESTTTAAYATGCSSAQGGVSIAGVSAEIGSAMKTGATGSEIVLAATVANGYSFDGWYSAATGGTKLSSSPRWKTFLKTRTVYAKFASSSSRLLQWEGSGTRKTMTWRSKTYVSPKPFNPVCCRVDAREYEDLVLKVDMYSSPDDTAKATGKSELDNIASQDPRRLPMRRPERYVQVEVTNDDEVDAILVGTSMEGIVA